MQGSTMKVVVVGGSSGIGRAVAAKARQRGAEVVLVGRSEAKLNGVAAELGASAVRADVSVEAEVERVFSEVGAFDHLVVTAVTPAYQPIQVLEWDAAQRALDSKVKAALLLAKHGGRRIREGGSITFTSGIAARRPSPKGAVIAAANGALEALTRALALELAPIRVNVVSPGWVDTPVWDALAGDGKRDAFERLSARLPAGRVGRPDELAEAYLFLMGSGFTTGTVLPVDGGHRLV